MSWIKLDDQWMDHPKIIRAGRDARDMWLASITWCAKQLTDGFIPLNLLPVLAVAAGINVANCQDFATTLIEVRLWDATDGGYLVHDYLDYNPSKEEVLATREARKEAGKAGGLAKASKMLANKLAKTQQNSAPSPSPSPSIETHIHDEILAHLDAMVGCPVGGQSDVEIAEVMLREYGADRFTRAASWAKDKHLVPMQTALRSMNTALRNGGFHDEQSKSNGRRQDKWEPSEVNR